MPSSSAALALAGVLLLLLEPAAAHWKPEYASAPQEVQDWYRNAEVTPEAQKRLFPYAGTRTKCCDNADVVKTRFRVSKTPDARDEWFEHAPDGQPTLFVWQGKETCFYPGEEGG